MRNITIENERIAALVKFLEIDSIEEIERIEELCDNEFETLEGDYLVLTDEEADRAVVEDIESIFDNIGLSSFTPNFQGWIIENAISNVGIFKTYQNEYNESYIEDIRDEVEYEDEDGNEVTRLDEEMKEAGCKDEDEYLDYLNEREDAIEWFKCSFGEDKFTKFVKENCSFDFEAIAGEAVSWDSRSHYLNRYDGSEDEVNIDGTTYYIYRTN